MTSGQPIIQSLFATIFGCSYWPQHFCVGLLFETGSSVQLSHTIKGKTSGRLVWILLRESNLDFMFPRQAVAQQFQQLFANSLHKRLATPVHLSCHICAFRIWFDCSLADFSMKTQFKNVLLSGKTSLRDMNWADTSTIGSECDCRPTGTGRVLLLSH